MKYLRAIPVAFARFSMFVGVGTIAGVIDGTPTDWAHLFAFTTAVLLWSSAIEE